MISKAQIKFIKSLQIKKFRIEHQQFLVQGKKNILELLDSEFIVDQLFVTEEFDFEIKRKSHTTIVSQKDLEKVSSFQSNNSGLAIVKTKPNEYLKPNNDWVLVLDQVKDPGNLGTIIRIADWYGIQKIVCSSDSVDLYNPKVINATMGSFSRVSLYYTDLEDYLKKHNMPVFGALLNGESIYNVPKLSEGYVLLGSESQGISNTLIDLITHKISIPKIGGAESLNVAVATGIICDNLLRK